MNLSLEQYNKEATKILRNMKYISEEEINIEMKRIENYMKDINTITHKFMNTYNLLIDQKEKNKIKNNTSINHKTRYSDLICDHIISDFSESESESENKERKKINDLLKNNIITKKKVSPGIYIPVICINNIDELPNFNIYHINDINQFAIKINGVVIRGNIGNIYDGSKHISGRRIRHCNNMLCKTGENKKKCMFYHDPLIFKDKNDIKNHLSSSWFYTNNSKNKKNACMRHVGNRNTLKNDINIVKYDVYEVLKYMDQTIHDILVIMAMNEMNVKTDYC